MARCLRLRGKVSGRSCSFVMLITAHSATAPVEAVMDEIAVAGYEGSIARTGYGLDKGVGERECRMPGTSAHGNPSWIT
ncbi:MAG: hypothetical protein KKC43_02415 [Alphaproteobacteria bacterium]|nr:hypothetical protein [Alphaproteobacteria bacterium]